MRTINLKSLEVPVGWVTCTLPDFTHLEMGQSPPSETYNHQKIGLPFFQGKAEFTSLHPEIDKYCSEPGKIANIGATLLSVRAPVGPTNLANIDCCIGRGLAGIHPLGGIEPKFILFLMRSIEKEISDKGTGSTFSAINKTFLEELVFALPPLSEQKRIVAKTEELFSELDNATECLLVAKAQQKIFYQSVLDSAFSNCKEHKKLEDLLSQKLSNGYSGKPVKHETNYRVLSLSSTTSGVFLDHHFKFLDEPTLEDRDIWCMPNDILIQRGNTIEYVGVPAIFTGMPRRFIFPDLMIRVRANENLISTKFLYYALSSPKIRNYLRQKAKGSAGTMPKINQSILASLPIPFCSKEAQKKIVEDIEEKLSDGLAIERTTEESLSKSKILRQSILKKAFSGKLVTQDPNDEPASVLLERIRSEKEAQRTESKKPKAVNPNIKQLDLIQIW